MMKDRRYQRMIEKYGIDDINEILSKNDYQSPEESDPDNDPRMSAELKRVFVYKLAWRSKRVSRNKLHVFSLYTLVTLYFLLIFLVNRFLSQN